MKLLIKNLLFNFTFNFSLFLILMVGIQNSSYKNKVNLLIAETVTLPLGFIIGTSFISGSIFGSIINLDFKKTN
tara:strand:+ start:253 stop:474 length:222 start_codon:yes stop_codon:yes gene_type:complete